MFDKLPLKVLKSLVKTYNLQTKIGLSKIIDGRRKAKTQKELSEELHKHLEIQEDGEIVLKKYINMSKLKPEPVIKPKKITKPKQKEPENISLQIEEKTKKVKKEPENISLQIEEKPIIEKPKPTRSRQAPKLINANDAFFIYDNQGKDEILDLTNVYNLDEVRVSNDVDTILDQTADTLLMGWSFMTKKDAVNAFKTTIYEMRLKNYGAYERMKERAFDLKSENRVVQVFVMRGDLLIGFIRSTFKKHALHIDYVFVNDKGFQGKGYVGEMLSLLFEYLKHSGVYSQIKSVDLDYFADSPSGWIAYDKGINRYGFNNHDLEYTDTQLANPAFIKKIHKKFHKSRMTWIKVGKGNGQKRSMIRHVEDIEMRI